MSETDVSFVFALRCLISFWRVPAQAEAGKEQEAGLPRVNGELEEQ